MNQGTLALGVRINDYDSGGLQAGIGAVQLQRGSPADLIAHQPFLAELGLWGRHALTKEKTFLQPYLLGNISALWMAWEYRRPMPSGTSLIRRDYLRGIDGQVGAGLSVRLHKGLRLFGEAVVGVMWLYSDSDEGVVKNDTIFNTFTYAGARAGLRLGF
jgi:hypothetical protein